ncbi:ABC transporter permease [Ruminococcus sp.]|uniref:ABC transporter permease n=1 Tax=Ruminococcus sp. TaxID=41978 RepID=UPI0025F9FBE2|nr:ABC transporter permease [Ruminococcus sp.]MBQ8965478.1 ABC transporter permease [Ruminococcus sp.]
MLFKLSLSNIRRSLKDYAVYFFTLLIGVAVFYVFNAISTQTAFLKISSDTHEAVDILKTLLSGMSVFVAGVLGLLIVYASRFLMKRRHREFALYMMLGMNKSKISALLLTETLLIGLGSLVIGLPVGIGLSQLMSALVAGLFEADMSEYRFIVSGGAVLKTCLYFGLMYVVVMLFNSFMISKSKLIDLMNSGKRSEKPKLKNPVFCVLIFIVAVLMLGYAYYNVGIATKVLSQKKLYICIIMGCISTFLIFWSVSGMLLKTVMSMKKTYFRGLNCFTFRQLSGKVNTVVVSMTIICLMLFLTICALCASFSLRNTLNSNIREFCPVDVEYELAIGNYFDDLTYCDIEEAYAEGGYDLCENLSEYVHINIYKDRGFTMSALIGDKKDEQASKYRFLISDFPETIVRVSDYNKVMELYGRDTLELGEDEFIVVCNYSESEDVRNHFMSKGMELNIFGNTLHSKYDKCIDGFLFMSAQRSNNGLYIVPDDAVDESGRDMDYVFGNFNTDDPDEKAALSAAEHKRYDEVREAFHNNHGEDIFGECVTRDELKASSVGLGAIVTFLGLYLGLVFLIACGAMLALKELSDNVDSAPRYAMLRRLGVEEKDIERSLLVQSGLFFLLPLLLAALHSIFGMRFGLYVLTVFGNTGLGPSIALTAVILALIYGGYFLITYLCSRSIIRERKEL